MGPTAVTNPAGLISQLKQMAPPPNPQTPPSSERFNPDQKALEKIKAATFSIQQAKEFINDPHINTVLDIIDGTLNKALLKFDGTEVMRSLIESVQSLPPLPQPGMGAMPQAGQSTPASPVGLGGSPMPGQAATPPMQ